MARADWSGRHAIAGACALHVVSFSLAGVLKIQVYSGDVVSHRWQAWVSQGNTQCKGQKHCQVIQYNAAESYL